MRSVLRTLSCCVALSLAATGPALAQPSPERAEAMKKLGFMSGIWAGPATGTAADGTSYSVHQTERMGRMLGGDVIVVEGRGYMPDGSVGFNALAVVSWDATAKKYELRSYAQGYAGTFELTPTETGYVWTIPMGPASIRYTAKVADGTWNEIGEYIAAGQPPAKVFEMNLKRIGDTDWPEGTPVPATTGR